MEHPAIVLTGHKKVKLKQINSKTTLPFKNEEAGKEKLASDIKKLAELQEKLFAESKQALLIVFQGMDTSGKDSTIKHVMSGINPQGCEVHSFKRPTSEEQLHDYLWRHNVALPQKGKIGIFNRSYYEDVTVVRVHKPGNHKKLWLNRFEEINNFERYLTDNGFTILKFFLHLSEEEQKERLLARIDDKNKHWKFDVSDISEREYWKEYQKAYEDVLKHTSTKNAPWIIVPADFKWSARLTAAHFIVKALEKIGPQFPKMTSQRETEIKKARKLLTQK